MVIAGLAISCVGLLTTVGVGLYVYKKSEEIMKKLSDAVLYTFPGAEVRKRLLDDIRRSGQIRGHIREKTLGEYVIDWKMPGQDKW